MSSVWLYATESVAWAAVGFLLGYVTAAAVRGRVRPPQPQRQHTPEAAPQRPAAQRLIGVVVVLLGVLTVAQGIAANRATERVVECQTRYANGFADSLEARTQASQRAQRSLDELMRSVGSNLANPNADQSVRVREAIGDYLRSRNQAERERAQNPYPPPPREACPE